MNEKSNSLGYVVKGTLVGAGIALGLMSTFPNLGYDIRNFYDSTLKPKILAAEERVNIVYNKGLENHLSKGSSPNSFRENNFNDVSFDKDSSSSSF